MEVLTTIAILTCIEAQQLITSIETSEVPQPVKVELIQTVLESSQCDGDV
jgi:hypothetical protein